MEKTRVEKGVWVLNLRHISTPQYVCLASPLRSTTARGPWFDTVDHQLLLHRIERQWVCAVLPWHDFRRQIISYLVQW